jgi:hypothetical protein
MGTSAPKRKVGGDAKRSSPTASVAASYGESQASEPSRASNKSRASSQSRASNQSRASGTEGQSDDSQLIVHSGLSEKVGKPLFSSSLRRKRIA